VDAARDGERQSGPVSARAQAYIIAGHQLHHQNILNETYFPAIPRA